jgi:hypothetical protein
LCCWRLLSLQSCNRRQSHVDAKRQTEIMVGIQLYCLHFRSMLLGEEHEDWLHTFFGMEKRMFLCDHQYDRNTWNIREHI